MASTRRICLLVEYDGSAFHGWQWQPNGVTVQQVLEEAVATVTGRPSRVVGSGRTDAGVHALGQVAAFSTLARIPGPAFAAALNANLRPDVRVLASLEVEPRFHPQHDATAKTYLYVILNRPSPSALLRDRAWHLFAPLDVPAMRRAAGHLVGRHDFSAFRSSGCSASSPVRTLDLLDLQCRGGLLEIRFRAEGFLRNMVRNLVGTLVEVGQQRRDEASLAELLASRDRTLAGPCAPPGGLYLVSVAYGSRQPAPGSLFSLDNHG